jgi:hypothetical protein
MTDAASTAQKAPAIITQDQSASEIDIPAHAQLLMVNRVVLPMLTRLGIPTTVQTTPQGLSLHLSIQGSADDAATGSAATSPDASTLSPEQAAELWALRERIDKARSAYEGT